LNETRPVTTAVFFMYLITGVDRHGKRFRIKSANLRWLLGHNVWRGNLWEILPTGKRIKIHSWNN